MTDPIRVLGGLYISSVQPLEAGRDLLKEDGIGSIVSVQKAPIPDTYKNYNRLQIPIDDLAEENLFDWYAKSNSFIEENLKTGSKKVLVHCNAGRSRSVAIVVAYLMKKYHLTYKQALYAVQRKYPEGAQVGPNNGFVKQLLLYYECGCTDDQGELAVKYPQYRAYTASRLKRDDLKEARAFKKETDARSEYILRCKKCGQVLANSQVVIPHEPPTEKTDKQKYFYKTAYWTGEVVGAQKAADHCTQYFVEPLKWMKPELDKGEIEGRFDCFKCHSKVGGYHWQGSRCSCGRWMTPAIYLQGAKTDRLNRAASAKEAAVLETAEVEQPEIPIEIQQEQEVKQMQEAPEELLELAK